MMSQDKNKHRRLPIPYETARELFSKCISRISANPVSVSDYSVERLSPQGRKSEVYKVQFYFTFPGEASPVLPIVVAKFYSASNGDAETNREEFAIERGMLQFADKLTGFYQGKPRKVYPSCFSGQVAECSDYLMIVREYIHAQSLLKIALKGNSNWADIRETIAPIALLHLNSPWLIQQTSFLKSKSPSEMADRTAQKLEKIARVTKAHSDPQETKRLRSLFEELYSRTNFQEGLIKVINGDLNASPRHATPTSLLDAGRTCIGPLTDDLSLYSDPVFSKTLGSESKPMTLLARGEAACSEYLEAYNALADNMHYAGIPVSLDTLTTSFLSSALSGSIKGAYASLVYGNNFLERPVPPNLTQARKEYIANAFLALKLLEDRPNSDRTLVTNIQNSILPILEPAYDSETTPKIAVV